MTAVSGHSGTFGLLLAGGASTRLGRDKATELVPGTTQTFAQNARELLREAGLPLLVAARDSARAGLLLPGEAAVSDGPGRGPAAALLGAHAAFPDASFLALACDLPEVPPGLLRALAAAAGDLVWPVWDVPAGDPAVPARGEPLCALYRPPALVRLKRRVLAGQFDLQGLAQEPDLDFRPFPAAQIAPFGDPAKLFFNTNRQEDLDSLAAWRQAPLPPSHTDR